MIMAFRLVAAVIMTTKILVSGIIAVLVIAGVTVLFRGGTQQSPETQNTPESPARKAPEFSLKDYDRNTVNLSDFTGKPLVINSWAVWCPFCKKELSEFAVVQKEVGDSVVFIAIDRAESLKTAKQFTDEIGVTDEMVFLLDPSDSFYRSIGGFSMPETIFVDTDGNIKIHKRGADGYGGDTKEIERSLRYLIYFIIINTQSS